MWASPKNVSSGGEIRDVKLMVRVARPEWVYIIWLVTWKYLIGTGQQALSRLPNTFIGDTLRPPTHKAWAVVGGPTAATHGRVALHCFSFAYTFLNPFTYPFPQPLFIYYYYYCFWFSSHFFIFLCSGNAKSKNTNKAKSSQLLPPWKPCPAFINKYGLCAYWRKPLRILHCLFPLYSNDSIPLYSGQVSRAGFVNYFIIDYKKEEHEIGESKSWVYTW